MDSHGSAMEKEGRLLEWFRAQGSALIGFSGGVDSAYLACVALEAVGPDRCLAVIGRSASYPAVQWEKARAVADRFGLPVHEVDTEELADPRYAALPGVRWNAEVPGRWLLTEGAIEPAARTLLRQMA
ncbi:MAG: hypothetical protein ACKOH8_03665, partial [Gemmatimonadota bacterium]